MMKTQTYMKEITLEVFSVKEGSGTEIVEHKKIEKALN